MEVADLHWCSPLFHARSADCIALLLCFNHFLFISIYFVCTLMGLCGAARRPLRYASNVLSSYT